MGIPFVEMQEVDENRKGDLEGARSPLNCISDPEAGFELEERLIDILQSIPGVKNVDMEDTFCRILHWILSKARCQL
jgi:hypothetical protein